MISMFLLQTVASAALGKAFAGIGAAIAALAAAIGIGKIGSGDDGVYSPSAGVCRQSPFFHDCRGGYGRRRRPFRNYRMPLGRSN